MYFVWSNTTSDLVFNLSLTISGVELTEQYRDMYANELWGGLPPEYGELENMKSMYVYFYCVRSNYVECLGLV